MYTLVFVGGDGFGLDGHGCGKKRIRPDFSVKFHVFVVDGQSLLPVRPGHIHRMLSA